MTLSQDKIKKRGYNHRVMNDSQFTLRELITQATQAVTRELSELRRAIEQLTKVTAGGYHDIESLKIQVASLSEGVVEIEQRLVILETHVGTQKWLVRQSVTVAVAVAIIIAWSWLR